VAEHAVTERAETQPVARRSRGRSIGLYVVLVLAGLLLLLASFAVWVNRVALNTEVFTDTSSQLIDDPEIRSAVAQRSVDELYANVDVEAVIEERLPEDVQRLAGPTAAALRQAAPQILERALGQPALARVWSETIERSHETLVQVLEGDGEVVETTGGVVVLDLRTLVLEAADRIGIRAQVEQRLPADAGRIEVLRADELDTAQDAFQILKALAWLLPILALLAFAGAVWLAPDRRRALRAVGITILVVGVVGLLAVGLTGNYVVDSLVEERDSRPAAANAWDILTELLRTSFRWLAVIGVLFVIAAWLAGPGRRAVAARKTLAPALQSRTWAYVALAVVAVLLLLTGAVTDFTRLLVVGVLVALGVVWIEVTRSQTLREFPGARGPELLDDARTRVEEWWDSRQAAPAPAQPTVAAPTAPVDVTARLSGLADLHARGELTDEEYASAKARVLAGA
jgi:hypothetical protein